MVVREAARVLLGVVAIMVMVVAFPGCIRIRLVLPRSHDQVLVIRRKYRVFYNRQLLQIGDVASDRSNRLAIGQKVVYLYKILQRVCLGNVLDIGSRALQ